MGANGLLHFFRLPVGQRIDDRPVLHQRAQVPFQRARNHIHHCARGLWLDWQAQGTRVTQNLFHDNQPPAGTEITGELALAEDLFVEVSHGPTLIDNNIFLSAVSARLCTQGLAFVHNLIAGSFSYVGEGVNNGGVRLATPRYTPYHVPHETELAGFMTILHGDARFYNNIFLQQPVSQEYLSFARANGLESMMTFTACAKPYEGYPTQEEYLSRFTYATAKDRRFRDMYYDHLPVWMNGNVYMNGALPCEGEDNHQVVNEKVFLSLESGAEGVKLRTDLFEHLPDMQLLMIDTELPGEAFEPEERFENPDGSPILFNRDYFGCTRDLRLIPGPFARREDAGRILF